MTTDELLLAALGEAAEFRQVAEAVVEWGSGSSHCPECDVCPICGFGLDNHCPGCPRPLAETALAARRTT